MSSSTTEIIHQDKEKNENIIIFGTDDEKQDDVRLSYKKERLQNDNLILIEKELEKHKLKLNDKLSIEDLAELLDKFKGDKFCRILFQYIIESNNLTRKNEIIL
jgi:hypothetical protein